MDIEMGLNLSMKTVQDIVEEQCRNDSAYLAQIRSTGAWLTDDVRELETFELVERLGDLGFDCSKQALAPLVRRHPSSESLFLSLLEELDDPPEGRDEDFVWLALTELWERWFPEVYNAEMLDDSMQAGYMHLRSSGSDYCAGLQLGVAEWERTWRIVKDLAGRFSTSSVERFDELFAGMQSLWNWSQDFDMELENAESFGVPCMGRLRYLTEFDHVFPLSTGHPLPVDDNGNRMYPEGFVPRESAPKRRKIGRNEPCPCGSGKKYKKCCGR